MSAAVHDAAAPTTSPFPLPQHRVEEARRIATEAGWPQHCPEPGCRRHGRCAGHLRTLNGVPRALPTCLHLAVRMMFDPGACTLDEADAFLGFVRPGEGFSMQPAHPWVNGWVEMEGGDGTEMSDAEMLLFIVGTLARRERETFQNS